MKWSRFVISLWMLLCCNALKADDSIKVQMPEDNGYTRRVERAQKKWVSLIPSQFIIQNAGNMGVLSAGIGWNSVYGHEFWRSQPGRYPDGYYEFMSTRFRLNIALGQRITFQIPQQKRRHHKSISFFYEISSCDLYIRSKIQDGSVPLKDILGLSLGFKFQAF